MIGSLGIKVYFDWEERKFATGPISFGYILTLLGRGVDRSRELGMGLSRLGSHHNISSVTGYLQGDRFTDATGSSGDEKGASS